VSVSGIAHKTFKQIIECYIAADRQSHHLSSWADSTVGWVKPSGHGYAKAIA